MATPALSTPSRPKWAAGMTDQQYKDTLAKNATAKPKAPKPPAAPLTPDQQKAADDAKRKAAKKLNQQNKAKADAVNPINVNQSKTPQMVDDVIKQTKDIDDQSNQIGKDAIDYSQNNDWAKQASDFNKDMLSGNMDRNPWEKDLWGDLEGATDPTEDAIRALLGYADGGSNAGGGARPAPGGGYYVSGGGGGYNHYSGSGGGAGGTVPDTVGGKDTFFAQKIKELFDPSTLDPANDPTMKPTIDALRRENVENTQAMLQDLAMQSEGSGLFGSGSHDYLMNRGREEGMESLDSSIAALLKQGRDSALGRRMEALGLTNVRDLGAMQDMTNRESIAASERASGAASGAASADAAEGRKLQALNMLLGAGSDIRGLKGNMASLRQGGQTAANQTGLGFANLGMGGYDTAINAGRNRLGSADARNNLISIINNASLGKMSNDTQRAVANAQNSLAGKQLDLQKLDMMNDSTQNLLQMLMGLGGLGGTDQDSGVPYTGGISSGLAALLGGLGGWNASAQTPSGTSTNRTPTSTSSAIPPNSWDGSWSGVLR